MKLKEATELFLADRARRGCMASTMQTYVDQTRLFSEFIQSLSIFDVSDITTHLLEKYIEHMRARGKQGSSRPGRLSAVTIFKRAKMLRTFFLWAHTAGHVDEDPSAKLVMPRYGRRLPKALKGHQVMKLLLLPMKPLQKAIVFLMLDSGLRLSEACGLDVSDVNLTGGTALIRQGKGDKDRIVIFSERTAEMLRQWLEVRKASADATAFFTNQFGKRMRANGMYRLVKKVAREAGLESVMRPHVLRHSFATLYLDNGGGIQDLSAMLGHTHIATTMIYISTSSEGLHRKHRRFSPITRMLDAPMPESLT
jgi:integrase/recombinase XerD